MKQWNAGCTYIIAKLNNESAIITYLTQDYLAQGFGSSDFFRKDGIKEPPSALCAKSGDVGVTEFAFAIAHFC